MSILQSEPVVVLPHLIDIAELAATLGVSVRHVRRMVAEKRIPYLKVGHFVRFDPDDVSRWLHEHRVNIELGSPRSVD